MTTTTQTQSGNRPVSKVRVGPIEASIWKNAGRNGDYHTVSFERRYRDAQGEWKSSRAFRASDLLNLAVAGYRAYEQLTQLEAGDAT